MCTGSSSRWDHVGTEPLPTAHPGACAVPVVHPHPRREVLLQRQRVVRRGGGGYAALGQAALQRQPHAAQLVVHRQPVRVGQTQAEGTWQRQARGRRRRPAHARRGILRWARHAGGGAGQGVLQSTCAQTHSGKTGFQASEDLAVQLVTARLRAGSRGNAPARYHEVRLLLQAVALLPPWP